MKSYYSSEIKRYFIVEFLFPSEYSQPGHILIPVFELQLCLSHCDLMKRLFVSEGRLNAQFGG